MNNTEMKIPIKNKVPISTNDVKNIYVEYELAFGRGGRKGPLEFKQASIISPQTSSVLITNNVYNAMVISSKLCL